MGLEEGVATFCGLEARLDLAPAEDASLHGFLEGACVAGVGERCDGSAGRTHGLGVEEFDAGEIVSGLAEGERADVGGRGGGRQAAQHHILVLLGSAGLVDLLDRIGKLC